MLLIVACSDEDSDNTAETIGDVVVDGPSIGGDSPTDDDTASLTDTIGDGPEITDSLPTDGGQLADGDGVDVEDFGGEQRHFFSFAFSTFRDVLIAQAERIVDLGADGLVVIYPDGITHTVNHAFFGVAGFDDACIAGFRESLAAEYTTEQLTAMGVTIPTLDIWAVVDVVLE